MKCYTYNKQFKLNCNKNNCRYWINKKDSNNCCLVVVDNYPSLTLEETGKIFGVTRMRICQLEKKAIEKLKDKLKSVNLFFIS